MALAARTAPRLEEVAGECERRDARPIAVATDVSDPDQCRHLIERTVNTFGRIDTRVNNAGVGMTARFDEVQDPTHYDRVMRINFLGSVYCTHAALPFLKQTKGRLVAIASRAARTRGPLYSAYWRANMQWWTDKKDNRYAARHQYAHGRRAGQDDSVIVGRN